MAWNLTANQTTPLFKPEGVRSINTLSGQLAPALQMTKLLSATSITAESTTDSVSQRPESLGPLTLLLNVLSSVPLGIATLILLFIYSSVGSAGILYPIHPNIFHPAAWTHAQLRQWRPFELTEFEWFIWWPFNLLIALLCVNLVITTVRRIPFKVINLGVWMIHTGIIILALGSVWYFSTKVEGDAPVIRRSIHIQTPGNAEATLVAMPGSSLSVSSGDQQWRFEVTATDPSWEIRSGADSGKTAFSVNVMITPPDGQSFIRQLLADYPEYTEDLIRTNDPSQPFKRAKKVLGEDQPLVNTAVTLSLQPDPQSSFYLVHSFALYLRERGTQQWIERPIDGLPRYNDYISAAAEVWPSPAVPAPDPIDISVPARTSDDPLAGKDLQIAGYLRYARVLPQNVDGGDRLNPVASLRVVASTGQQFNYELEAFNPALSTAENGAVAFRWAATPQEFESLRKPPHMIVSVPKAGIKDLELSVPPGSSAEQGVQYQKIEGTDYEIGVRRIEDALVLGNQAYRLAILSIRTPSGEFSRWAFEDASLTRDRESGSSDVHGAGTLLDPDIDIRYVPGRGVASLLIVAGPEENALRAVVATSPTESRVDSLVVGSGMKFDQSLDYAVTSYAPRAVLQNRPWIVPVAQRDRDADVEQYFTLAKVQIPDATPTNGTPWVRFHKYPFESEQETLMRYYLEPTVYRLKDGREIEVILSRRRMSLPDPVILDSFHLTTNVGGYTGEQGTIRDYTSQVSFITPNGNTPPESVSTNAPISHGGYAYFQAFWDPPLPGRGPGDPGSKGMNYTVLGVGNREGVWVQLFGCCLAVVGMIYAFYVKPAIKRRRRMAVLASLAAAADSKVRS